MSDIYQKIWDADQKNNGIKAIVKGAPIDNEIKSNGYVVVDERKDGGREQKVIAEVVIPENKQASYERVEKLFNNYVLDQTKPEINTTDEDAEVQEFIKAIVSSKPMIIARDYASEQSGRELNEDDWWGILQRVWFEQFNIGINKDLSGFEHVIVGEQKQGKVQGYHFWYKYYLDEHFRFGEEETDAIDFLGLRGKPDDESPEVVTLSYEWKAFDYVRKEFRKLTKPVGGFWVGCSIEGLMAIGTVRFLPEALAPKKAEINKVIYNLQMFRSPNDRNLRTFYPEFVSMV